MRCPEPYVRRVNYYETDKMAIVHHSNYIRWFEEAREDFVRKAGIDYEQIEANGILMAVVGVSCEYKYSARYGDIVVIETRPVLFNGVRLNFEYTVREQSSGRVLVTGTSSHCFLGEDTRRPLNLERRMPEYCAILGSLMAETGGDK